MKRELKRRFEYIYHMIIGIMIEQDEEIENEFAQGKECESLYSEAYDARVRITKAINKIDDDDNMDALIIARAYEKMQEIIARRCYLQGYADAINEITEK